MVYAMKYLRGDISEFALDGKRILYNGMIIFDLGAFTVALADIPRFYIMIYLMGGIIFTGAIEILRAMEKKKLGAGYKFKLVQGMTISARLSWHHKIWYSNRYIVISHLFTGRKK